MNVIDLKKVGAVGWIDDIVSNYQFKPYWWIRQVNAESRQRLMQRQLQQLQQDGTAVLLGVYTEGDSKLAGFAAIYPLSWDTDHFGISVWRVSHLGVWGDLVQQRKAARKLAQVVVTEALCCKAQTLHIWIPLDAIHVIHALEAAGFLTMESQVYWLFDLTRQSLPRQQTTATFRPHQPADTEALVSLAQRVYTPIPNRFHADPHLSQAACDALYAKWLRNSCIGETADYISVIDVEGKVVGYGTLRFLDNQDGLCNARMGQFLLGAIDPDFRQRGLYDDLLRSLLVWLVDRRAEIAFVGTQTNNVAAQAAMAQMGWRPVNSGLSLHLWLAKG